MMSSEASHDKKLQSGQTGARDHTAAGGLKIGNMEPTKTVEVKEKILGKRSKQSGSNISKIRQNDGKSKIKPSECSQSFEHSCLNESFEEQSEDQYGDQSEQNNGRAAPKDLSHLTQREKELRK